MRSLFLSTPKHHEISQSTEEFTAHRQHLVTRATRCRATQCNDECAVRLFIWVVKGKGWGDLCMADQTQLTIVVEMIRAL
jgi:hypothetical protein